MPNPKNKTVLLIAYYFPPLGMGGVGRPYAIFRYLPDYGYNVVVLTVRNILYPQYDYSLLNEKDNENIYRSGSVDPARVLYLLGKRKQSHSGYPTLNRKLPLYFPDLKRGWIGFAKRKLKALIQNNDISAVITTAPPPSVNLLGLEVKKMSNIPWVADLRDYWFSLPIEKIYPNGKQKIYALRLKAKIQKQADLIISVNTDIKKYYGRGEVLRNGADRSVIELWKKSSDKSSKKLSIGLLGTFNYLVPVEPLFYSIRKIINSDLNMENKIEIIHVGNVDNDFNNLINKYALDKIVIKRGYMERPRAVETLLPCDLLYIAVNKFDEYHILPGRIFDYLVSGKPVLGVVPENSDIASLLEEYPYGTAITDYDTDKIVNYLKAALENKLSGAVQKQSFEYDVDKYSMSTLAQNYAEVLNQLLQ